jgi:hypothetical protein
VTDDVIGRIEVIVREAAMGRTPMAALGLAGILTEIDYRERIVASREELDDALGRLVRSKMIGEFEGHQFVDGRSASNSHHHRTIGATEYDRALREYRSHEALPDEELPPTDPHLQVRLLNATGPTSTENDWRTAERLAILMCERLAAHGRETRVASIKTGPVWTEFWVLGRGDDDPERLDVIVRPLFEDVAPAGSTLSARSPLAGI